MPVIRPEGVRPLHLIILGSPLVGCWTHWFNNASRPCMQPPNQREVTCPGCLSQMPRRWKGYIGCWDERSGRRVIAEISANAARSCPDLIDKLRNLRGITIELQRMAKKENAAVDAKLLAFRRNGGLPDPFDVVSHLYRLWGDNPYLASPKETQGAEEEEYPWGTGDPELQERS